MLVLTVVGMVVMVVVVGLVLNVVGMVVNVVALDSIHPPDGREKTPRHIKHVRTGTQGLINPKKSCRRFCCVSGVGTYLGNMPECVLTPGDDVPTVPFWKNTVFTV